MGPADERSGIVISQYGASTIPVTKSPSLIWLVADISGGNWAEKQRIQTQHHASSAGPIKGDLQMTLNLSETPSFDNLRCCMLGRLAGGILRYTHQLGRADVTDRPSAPHLRFGRDATSADPFHAESWQSTKISRWKKGSRWREAEGDLGEAEPGKFRSVIKLAPRHRRAIEEDIAHSAGAW